MQTLYHFFTYNFVFDFAFLFSGQLLQSIVVHIEQAIIGLPQVGQICIMEQSALMITSHSQLGHHS